MWRSKSILVSIALVFTLIVGCSSNNGNNSASPSTNNSPSASNKPAEKPADDKPVEIRMLKPGSPGDSPEIPRVEKAIEDSFYESTGIRIDLKLEFYDWDVLEQKYTLDIASGKAADFGRFPNNLFFKFYDKGYFQPIGDVMKAHAPNLFKQMSKEEIEAGYYKGEMAGVPLGGFPINYIMVIRQDKLDALGLQMPKTVADFENVMAAYKKAYPNEYPLHGVWFGYSKVINALNGITNFAGSGKGFVMKPDGTVTSYFMHDNIEKYNEMANRWYKNGWVSPDYLTIGDESEAEFIKDSGLAIINYHANGLENVEQTASSINPNAKGAVVPNLQADWGIKTAPFDGYNSEGYIGISKTVSPEKAEIIAKLINWELDSLENFMMGKRGQLGIDWDYVDKPNRILDKLPKWKEDGANGYSWEHWMINRAVFSDEISFQVAGEAKGYEQILDYIQSAQFTEDPMLKTPYLPLGDLAAKVDELNVKLGFLQSQIVVGKRPLSDWSEAKKIWEDGGGLELEKQITEIYKSMTE